MTAAVAFDTNAINSAFRRASAPMFLDAVDPRELPKVQPLSQYEYDPIGFMTKVLGIPEYRIRWSLCEGYELHTWDGTVDPLVVIAESLSAWMDTAVESGTGTGKSYIAAALILWFLAAFGESRVFSFAPKEEQLRAFMWAEIGKLWPRFQLQFPTAVLTDLRIRMRGPRDGFWGAQGFAVGRRANEEVSVNAQGMHAEHMMLVYEECPGIAQSVIEAGENTCTAPHNLRLALGNPDNQLDALHLFGYDQFGAPRPGVQAVRISSLDHPNIVTKNAAVVPGAVSVKSIDTRRTRYTEDGRLFKSRVRGLSPSEAAEALIKLEWVRAAQLRWLDENDKRVLTREGKAKKALGVDVANSEGGDEAAVSRWTGAFCREVTSFACPNANNLGFNVSIEMRDDKIDDEHVGVDAVGVGVGAVNELRKRDRWIKALGSASQNALDKVGEDEEYNVPRSQWYWTLREDLRKGEIALPPDAEMTLDLITPTWKTHNGKIIVESKETVKLRLPNNRSTNKGDAVVYGNWVRDRSPALSLIPKKTLTTAQRLQKELEDMDRNEKRQAPGHRAKYGSPLRQG